jgi:rod shape-determining protein MreC
MPQGIFSKNLIKFASITAVCLLLVFLNPKKIFNPVREVFFKVGYPFQKTFFILGHSISGATDFFGSIGRMRSENERLIREGNSLAAEIGALKDAKKENEILREQLGLAPRDKFNLEAAFVIGQDPQGLGSWIMIDKGRDAGLNDGMAVVVSDGILIGRIDEVYQSSAKINLLADSSSAINAMDVETQAKGIVRGEYGLGLAMDMVAQTDVLSVGDTIVTSGLGGDLPKGLTIGKIQEVRSSQDKLFQQAILTPRVKYSKLDIVFAVKN